MNFFLTPTNKIESLRKIELDINEQISQLRLTLKEVEQEKLRLNFKERLRKWPSEKKLHITLDGDVFSFTKESLAILLDEAK